MTPWRKDTSGMRTLYYVPLYLRITQPQELGHHIHVPSLEILNRKVSMCLIICEAAIVLYHVPNRMLPEMTSIKVEQ